MILDRLFKKLIYKLFERADMSCKCKELEKELFEEFEAYLIRRDFADARSYIETAHKQGYCVCKMRNMYFNAVDNNNDVIF